MKWYKIFNSLEIATQKIPVNTAKLLLIGDRRICLAHTLEGFFAVSDTCTHLGESLSKGNLNYLNEVICPWHSYRFNLKTGEECERRCRALETYAIKLTNDGLFIGLITQ
ncbi:Rieske 2Fe-2S domain-containing protein [Fulvivirgaceae bacterium BMA10]|uniref:Rieske 2Fe-2S domain-containing protein n=1 Tax=Splendidivirga corallicola TaxID=3051826 RepID=A0ABT8KPF2_9BACT|nr:Rieske 2Fe-2S domain-containing protein [Fulvivirgaceae bacterium BMA10]